MLKKALLLLPIVVAILLWFYANSYEQKNFAKDVQYPCVSYAPYNITQKERYTEKELRTDLEKIKLISSCVRIYSVTNGLEQIPAIAESLGMDVIIGAWLDKYMEVNEQEIANLVSLAKNHSNIKYVVVGNETQLMKRVDEEYLIENLDLVRKLVKQPVTTTEPPQVWLMSYDLQDHIDFVGLHKFPFWEEVPFEESIDSMKSIIEEMREITDLPIVVLETGWPSNGLDQGAAEPGLIYQKKYLEEIGKYFDSEKIFYNIAEGIDVPSKLKTTEGLIGLHWGILTYTGESKHIFSLKDLGRFIFLYIVLFIILYVYNKPVLQTFHRKVKGTEVIFMLAAVAVSTTLVFFYKLYMTVMPIFQIFFTLLMFYGTFECCHKYVQFRYAHLVRKKILEGGIYNNPDAYVSILVAAKDESPQQVIKTLESLIAQTHSHTEVLYVDNNSVSKKGFDEVSVYFTKNPSTKLKLFYKEKIQGFKAGALNYLLTQISSKSEYVAVIDSDYIVDSNWIETALTYVQKNTGFVQFPQAYDIDEEVYKNRDCIQIGSTVEQQYVFDVVYPVRSYIGDVVQNGTMVMINRKYLSNGWPTFSICEDAALGLEISKQGGTSVYVPLVMGRGTPPKTFSELRKQRNRWVFGAIQILKKGLRHPKSVISKTYVLFFLDWLGWIMQGLYPVLLVSSVGYIIFLWLVYLHLQISWVMFVGFAFVFISLALFIATYWVTYKHKKFILHEIYSLIIMEFALVNTISKTILSGFIFNKANFVTTRQKGKVKLYDLFALGVSTTVLWIGLFLCLVLFLIRIPIEVKLIGVAQLSVVMLPQLSYIWLRYKY